MGLRTKIRKFLYTRKFSKKKYLTNINKKNILITGANSGIGLALTKRFLELDNKVLAVYRENSQNLINIKDSNLSIIKYDLKKIDKSENFENKIKETSVDLIINCAGVFGPSFENQQIENLDFEKFQEVLMVNSISILKLIQIMLNHKISTKNLEILVNISSDAGSIDLNNEGNAYMYRASKTALNSITKNMSIDLMARFKTIVFAIDPGNVQSGMNPGGTLKADVCANLIINLISSNVQLLNGKFVNLLGDELPW
ncbi:SDR family NAD(P)-dependent oxidoreductase [Alphaproteobacteria bacterium]|jgi:NAD(P)-dependent dehydrogenase (short-subunit alcohol dehydrogenase family)|nr:SDR family NAD(P)-dependent oxidoreductase [Alphaproteobacteria bacterium]|tara:strand:+ start:165 stop:932 length:768 start_codon:yes stop_codon:yes gene_type:complete